MRRRWVAFDRERMNDEFRAMPSYDRGTLFDAMAAYRKRSEIVWMVDRYAGGLMRIRSRSKTSSGRCLFFATTKLRAGEETLVAVTAYKKEATAVPRHVLRRAMSRMEEWKRRNGIT
ncbi:MAG: hypothetical protein WD716_03580 [Fimbriimonadaceae bacterium]